MDRRLFIKALGTALLTPYAITINKAHAGGGAPAVPPPTQPAQSGSTNWERVFTWSVASGDPSPSGAVIWTRVSPASYASNKLLSFEVSTNREFSNIVFAGNVNSSELNAQRDYTANIDLDGQLNASSTYYYRFKYDGEISRTGRFKTLPANNASVEQIKIGVLTCQDYTTGFFNAYSRLAEEELDFVVHLGDFIYEYDTYGHGAFKSYERTITMPSGYKSCDSLEDFRHVYRLHRADKNLQRAMEQHAFVIVWDDHETANDNFHDYENDTLGLPEDDERHTRSAAAKRQLRLDAQRAWVEYVPARVQVEENSTNPHNYLKMYRQLKCGNLLDLFMTDSRTYRTQQPCEDGGTGAIDCKGTQVGAPQSTMLGAEQKNWMINGMLASNAKWKVWGNQTMVSQMALTLAGAQLAYLNLDQWDGYQHERHDIIHTLKQNGIDSRLVVLTGDLHTAMTGYVKLDYGNINNWDYANLSGVEIMTPAVTSPGADESVSRFVGDVPLNISWLANGFIQINNPHIKDFSTGINGYTVIDFKREGLEYAYYNVEKRSDNPDAVRKLHHEFTYDPKTTWIKKKS